MTKIEILSKIREVIDAKGADPADELVKLGEALVGVGKALKGQTPADARAILEAVAALELGAKRQ